MDQKSTTRYDELVRRLKDHPLIAAVLVAFAVVLPASQFLYYSVVPWKRLPPKQDDGSHVVPLPPPAPVEQPCRIVIVPELWNHPPADAFVTLTIPVPSEDPYQKQFEGSELTNPIAIAFKHFAPRAYLLDLTYWMPVRGKRGRGQVPLLPAFHREGRVSFESSTRFFFAIITSQLGNTWSAEAMSNDDGERRITRLELPVPACADLTNGVSVFSARPQHAGN